MLTFFFFSSRRRHTRCSRDWSSDVCSSDLDGESRAGEAHGTAQKKHNNVFAACAKGHSNADLRNALRNKVMDHSVDACRGQQQRKRRKQSHQPRLKPPRCCLLMEYVLHGFDAGENDTLIERTESGANGLGRQDRAGGGSHHETGRSFATLRLSFINFRHRRPFETMAAHIRNKPDNEIGRDTSELQSRLHLVCRLLLEKKKKKQTHPAYTSAP